MCHASFSLHAYLHLIQLNDVTFPLRFNQIATVNRNFKLPYCLSLLLTLSLPLSLSLSLSLTGLVHGPAPTEGGGAHHGRPAAHTVRESCHRATAQHAPGKCAPLCPLYPSCTSITLMGFSFFTGRNH